MTATVWTRYDKWVKGQLDASETNLPLTFTTDTIRMMILTSAYTPNKATDGFRSDIVANEVSGTNYTARGILLSGKYVTLTSGVITIGAADITVSQSGSGFSTGQTLVIYKDSGTNSTSPLIAFNNVGSAFGNLVGDLSILINTNGILALN